MSSSPVPRPHLAAIPRAPSAAREASLRLPVPLTSLVGRERELAAVAALLRDPAVRLVTLTGPGGVGKTRLALRLAADLADDGRFADGAVVVELAAVRDPDQVATAIAQALGVRLAAREPGLAGLTDHLRNRDLLLVLDNFEQIVDAAPQITELLRACPGLTALVTSRALLRVTGECAVAVSRLLDADAEHLFVERARAVAVDFAFTAANATAVAEICRCLDGLPLAIELAAARSGLFTPPALLGRLDRRLSQLTIGPRDAPARHRTMRDAIAWSHDLLPPAEQAVFRRLGVFVGGCTLEAAEAVCGPEEEGGGRKAGRDDGPSALRLPPSASVVEAVEALIHQSLLGVVTPAGGDAATGLTRVAMLETVREFALEQLAASGEEEAVREAHARWCLALAEEADSAYRQRIGHARWLERLQADHANIRAALAWLRDAGQAELNLQLAGMLSGFWYFRGHLSEGRSWLAQALERLPDGPPAMRARALRSAGLLAHYQGDDHEAMPALAESLSLWRTVGDPWGTALTLLTLGAVAEDSCDYDQAETHFEEALALLEAESYPLWCALARYHLGVVAFGRGDLARAAALEEQAGVQFREAGDSWGIASSLGILGLVAVETGDLTRAADCFAEALPVVRELRFPESLLRCLAGVAALTAASGRPHEAARLFGAAAAMAEVLGLAIEMPERAIYDRATEAVREQLGEPDFATAWAAGRTLSREDAIAEALELVRAPLPTPRPSLTRRESQILRLIAEDMPDAAIAETLFLSVRTVEWHVSHILTKLGVRSRADATTAGREAGLIEAASR